ncbi:MAG: nucleoside monophosphate kinase [Candidatus Micrarchaeota archaeon]
MGKPGTGKSTQAGLVSKKYGVPHISGGELLREEVKKGTALGARIKEIIGRGGLVTEELGSAVLLDLVEKKLKSLDCSKGFILDGIPRTIESAADLDVLLRKHNAELNLVVNLELSDQFLLDRLKYRLTCNACGATYNLVTKPPKRDGKCDSCHGSLGTRIGDSEIRVMQARIRKYNAVIKPILDYYFRTGKLRTVDLSSVPQKKSVNQTQKAIRKHISDARRGKSR